MGKILHMQTAEIHLIDKLQAEISNLHNLLAEKDHCLAQKDQDIVHLEEQLSWFKRQIFGQRSERVVADLDQEQLSFPGFENLQTAIEEKKKNVAAHTRKPNRDGKDKIALHPDLPVKTIVLDLPEDKKVCPETGEALVQIGKEVSYKLAHQPGSYFIKEIIRPKYACPQKEEAGIFTADLPECILPKCRADNSLLAEIITQKFVDHLPLYRIVEIMGRQGVVISRKLLSQWVIRTGMALKPLYEEMQKHVLKSENIYIDEIPVKLQEKEKCKLAYMWVVVGGSAADPPYRIYDFRESRSHDHVQDILKGYHGVLHSDKYGAYERLAEKKQIIWCPCWSHIRRKFFEAETDAPFQAWVLRKIKYLFMLERVGWSRSAEEKLQIRQEKEIPIIDELIEKIKAKLVSGKVLPKSKLREALGYFSGLIPYMKNYTQHPFARLDNNVAERAVRPLAIGRKNWLFFGSPSGGEAGAILFSLVQTCRGLGINPREYIEDIFGRLLGHSAQRLHELLPDQWLASRRHSTI